MTVHDALGFAYTAALPWLFAFASMTALELLLPRGRKGDLAGRLPGLLFWSLWVPVSMAIGYSYRLLWSALGIPPLVVLPLDMAWTGALASVLAPIVGAAFYDFFFYWCHRAQHRWLWRFHAVHHSIEDLSAVNAHHHISEPLIQAALIMLPISLISYDIGIVSVTMAVIIQVHASYIHSPVNLHLGPASAVIVDNRFHRIHHSVEHRHFDKNFGAFTTIWDRLFGTAWMPGHSDWPDTGIAEARQPRSVGQWLSLPWRMHSVDAGVPEVAPDPAHASAIDQHKTALAS